MSKHQDIVICDKWNKLLQESLSTDEMQALMSEIDRAEAQGRVIMPLKADRFKAFERTPFDRVKCIIIGQDPYMSPGVHSPCIAMGLSFSVPKNEKIPPSLRNIYKEINRDIGIPVPTHGDLSCWADEGVFLLNCALTVEKGMAGSHSKMGWQLLTKKVITAINDEHHHCVFMLWGNHAKVFGKGIDRHRHLVLETSHPSPLGVRHGFHGCGHFSTANNYLVSKKRKPINWGSINEIVYD